MDMVNRWRGIIDEYSINNKTGTARYDLDFLASSYKQILAKVPSSHVVWTAEPQMCWSCFVFVTIFEHEKIMSKVAFKLYLSIHSV